MPSRHPKLCTNNKRETLQTQNLIKPLSRINKISITRECFHIAFTLITTEYHCGNQFAIHLYDDIHREAVRYLKVAILLIKHLEKTLCSRGNTPVHSNTKTQHDRHRDILIFKRRISMEEAIKAYTITTAGTVLEKCLQPKSSRTHNER